MRLVDGEIPPIPEPPTGPSRGDLIQDAQERAVAVQDATRRRDPNRRLEEMRDAEGVMPELNVPGLSAILEPGAPVDLGRTRDVMMDIEGVRRYRGPRLRLSGTVFYRPLRPYDPAPTIPEADASRDDELLSDEDILFEYPEK